jgi:hypothetical protein
MSCNSTQSVWKQLRVLRFSSGVQMVLSDTAICRKSSSILFAVWSWVAGFQAFRFPCFHCYAVCLYICCVNEWTLVVFSTITIANWGRRDLVSTSLRHSFVHQSVILFLFSLLIVGFLFSNVALRVCRHTGNFGGQWTCTGTGIGWCLVVDGWLL